MNSTIETTDKSADNVTDLISAGNLTSLPGHVREVHYVYIIRIVTFCVIWPIIIFPGIFGNILSLIVIRKTETSSTTSKFLTSLAVADTMNLIVKGALMVFTWGFMFWPHQYLTWKLSTLSVLLLSYLPEMISKGITAAIVCDRSVALTAPLRYKVTCRPIRITAILVVLTVVIVSTSLPTIVDFFRFQFTKLENRTINTNIGQRHRSQITQSSINSIHVMATFLLFDCMPIPIVFVGNIIIICSLRKRKMLASTTSEVQQQRKLQERQLTKLLLTISMLFFSLTGPSAVYRILAIVGVTPSNTAIAVMVGNILQTLSLTNSAVNFVVYVVMNKKYREGYLAIMCRCRRSIAIEEPMRN